LRLIGPFRYERRAVVFLRLVDFLPALVFLRAVDFLPVEVFLRLFVLDPEDLGAWLRLDDFRVAVRDELFPPAPLDRDFAPFEPVSD
jgi:hypothetical protein